MADIVLIADDKRTPLISSSDESSGIGASTLASFEFKIDVSTMTETTYFHVLTGKRSAATSRRIFGLYKIGSLLFSATGKERYDSTNKLIYGPEQLKADILKATTATQSVVFGDAKNPRKEELVQFIPQLDAIITSSKNDLQNRLAGQGTSLTAPHGH